MTAELSCQVAIRVRDLPSEVESSVRIAVDGATYVVELERVAVYRGTRRLMRCPSCPRRVQKLFAGPPKGLACAGCQNIVGSVENAATDPLGAVLRARAMYVRAAKLTAPHRVRDSDRRRRGRELERRADALVAGWVEAFEADCSQGERDAL